MPSDPYALLFGGVLALALLLAFLEWHSHHRRMAVAAMFLAALAAVLLAFELASVPTSIRVDLFITVPMIALAAAVVGLLAILGPPLSARAVGGILIAVGAGTLGWCGWSLAVSTAESNRQDLARDEGLKLYWQETTLCQVNFEKRFGPLQRRDSSCFGNLAVTSKSDGAYPYTRLVVNDNAQFDLLFSVTTAAEDTKGYSGLPFAPLKPRPDGRLYIESDPARQQPAVELRPTSNGACEARISNDYLNKLDHYTLRRVDLGSCPAPVNPPVHFLGAWASLEEVPSGSATLELRRVWLWGAQGKGYALLAADAAQRGADPPLNFAQRLTGTRDAQGVWQLRSLDGDRPGQVLSVAIDGSRMQLHGTPDLLRSSLDVTLHPTEIITHPKIALAPVRDAALFASYFDTVLLNLEISWTPQ